MTDSASPQTNPPENIPCFFFSYARKDVDKYLQRFFSDLSETVAKKGGLDAEKGQVSFKDIQDIEPGQDWASEISHALQHSRALVCVYSTWYFQREYCGKEFHVFLKRTPDVRYEEGYFVNSSFIIPLLWLNQRDLDRRKFPPSCLDRIQAFDPEPNKTEKKKKRGLRQILLTEGRRGKYQKIVDKIADKILDISMIESPLAPLKTMPKLGSVKSIFHDMSDWEQEELESGKELDDSYTFPPGKGLRIFLLSYISSLEESGSACSPVGLRSSSYADQETSARSSDYCDVIGAAMDEAAFSNRFESQEVLISSPLSLFIEKFVCTLEEAGRSNTVIVIVLDSQNNLDDRDLDQIETFIQTQKIFFIVLHILEKDSSSGSFLNERKHLSSNILYAKFDLTNYKSTISKDVAALLVKMQSLIVENGEVKRSTGSSETVERPLLQGPGVNRRYE